MPQKKYGEIRSDYSTEKPLIFSVISLVARRRLGISSRSMRMLVMREIGPDREIAAMIL